MHSSLSIAPHIQVWYLVGQVPRIAESKEHSLHVTHMKFFYIFPDHGP